MEQFGKYQLIRQLGAGGMAEVFLAKSSVAQGLAKQLVIKKIHTAFAKSKHFVTMFVDEAKIALGLNHPNIVQVFDFGHVGQTYFLAMEHVEGMDLLRLLQEGAARGRRTPYGLCAYIVQQTAKGLDYAHRKADEYGEPLGIVHRDISPQNIIISWDGAVKIVDFGIARARDVHEEEGVVKGKFAYMSPEQARGEPVDHRSDIFSLGIVLYELACARPLFTGKGKEALEQVKRGEIPRPREVDPYMPEALAEIIDKALAMDKDVRFATARDMQMALARFMQRHAGEGDEIFDSSTLAQFMAQVAPDVRPHRATAPPIAGAVPALGTTPQDSGGLPLPPRASPAGGIPALSARSPATPAPTPPRKAVSQGATPVPMAPDAAVTPAGKRSAADIPVPGAAPARELRERKHVLVVEGQLTGLGALRRRVGDARADKTVADFFRIAEHIAFKQEAHAHRQGAPGDASFAYVIGLPVAGEDDPSRAIRLALALVDALDGIGRDVEPELRLSVGIQRGVAVVRRTGATWDYELPAETTSIAQRLAREAQGGEVLVGGGVYRIARNDWNFEELAAIDLPEGTTDTGKPIAELLLAAGLTGSGTDPGEGASPRTARVYRLRGPKERSERLKERQAGGTFIGRELELKTLRETYRECQLRRGKRMVLVSGEPGIGKRALVAAFLKTLGPGDAMVLRAAARAATRDTPYAIIADLARDMMGLADGAEPREVQRRLQLAASALYPGEEQSREVVALTQTMGMLLGVKVAGASLGEIDADERHHRILAALQRVEERLSRDTPLVIVIEDLHWIDSASAEVMSALLTMNTPLPILGISTARPDERILANARANGSLVIELDELPAAERDELLATRFAPGEDVSLLTNEIVAKAGGNPFYLNELIESLVERGVLVQERAQTQFAQPLLRWVRKDVALAVPASLELAVATRLDRLPGSERETLTRAAVLGRKFTTAEVEAFTGRPAAQDLEALGKKQVLDPGPQGWQFKNELMLEVAYELLPVDERAALHRRAAELLLAAPGFREGQDDARLARHHERAGDLQLAIQRWLSAGHHALATRASIEALSHFGRALALMPKEAHAARFAAHAEREGILRLITRRPQQLREIHLMRRCAQAAGDQAGVAEALLRLAQFNLDVGRAPQAKKTLADALAAARAAGSKLAEAAVWRTEAQVARAIGRPEEALALCNRALGLLDDSVAAMSERGSILNVRGGVYYTMSRLREAIETWAESLIIHRKLRAPRQEARALNNMGIVFAALGEFDEALTHYKRSLKIDQDLGNRSGLATKLSNIGQVYLEVGLYEKAEQYLGKSLALCRELKEQRVGVDATISLAQVYLRQGVLGRARTLLERGLDLAVREGDRYQEIRAMQYLALTQLAAGTEQGVLELAQKSTRLAGEAAMGVGLVYGHAIIGLALAAQGQFAPAVLESQRAIDEMATQEHAEGAEEILAIHGRLLIKAGQHEEGRLALARAAQLVREKASQLRDEELRKAYLASPPMREILEAAGQA